MALGAGPPRPSGDSASVALGSTSVLAVIIVFTHSSKTIAGAVTVGLGVLVFGSTRLTFLQSRADTVGGSNSN
jgi:hypothetical protein